jgi:probable DNA repair protein
MSPLLINIAEITESDLPLCIHIEPSERIFLSKSIDHFSDDLSTPYTSLNVSGGVDILKQQALCPFKAFSTHRLNARELESPLPGLRPKDRGKFIHKILENIWGKIKNFEHLSKLSTQEREEIVSKEIKKCILELKSTQPNRTKYFELEENRLHVLISDWLDLELKREPFEVISHEKTENITIGSLNLSLRVDRVDKLINGYKMVIDYKTGKNNSISSWFDDRIDEPQLPIYALLDPSSTIGICFAQVTSSENKFLGISQYDIGIPGVKSLQEVNNSSVATWPDQIQKWKTDLETLSNEFSSGWALVNPKENEQTCKYCKLHSLCRIYQYDQR